jgi:hypothetical protein
MVNIPTLNFVQLTGTFINGLGQPNSGDILFEMSDILWDATDKWIGIIAPIGAPINSQGTFAVSLLAMDNGSISGNWSWKCTMHLDGLTFPPRLLAVNFAAGAVQDISGLLTTSKLA